jgi:hypothetical protein
LVVVVVVVVVVAYLGGQGRGLVDAALEAARVAVVKDLGAGEDDGVEMRAVCKDPGSGDLQLRG